MGSSHSFHSGLWRQYLHVTNSDCHVHIHMYVCTYMYVLCTYLIWYLSLVVISVSNWYSVSIIRRFICELHVHTYSTRQKKVPTPFT